METRTRTLEDARRIGRVVLGGRSLDFANPRPDGEFAAIQSMWRGERCCARWCAMGRRSPDGPLLGAAAWRDSME